MPESVTATEAAREGTMRSKLPPEIRELVDATQTDIGAPLEPDAAEILRKARSNDPATYERFRFEYKRLNGRLSALDQATAPTNRDDGKQGQPIEWNDPEPWLIPVDGAALLDDLVALLERYASLPEGGAVAVALWALYAWCFRAFAVCPNLMVTAPERESGKTRVTEILSWATPRAKPVSDASAAAIIRGIERDGPTLLFDEAQHFLRRRPGDPIRGILLASFTKRFAIVERCEGDAHEVRTFSTFCPKAMNGRNLTAIDDMLTSRSVAVPMMRATSPLPELRADRDPVGEDLRRQCARWRDDHLAELREADPDTGERIGRIAQVWRPLFSVADAAGGEWPKKARAAADALAAMAATFSDGETLGLMLLTDVRAVFEEKGNPQRIASKELDEALRDLPERPWASMPKTGKAITAQARGRMLAGYGVKAETLRFDDAKDAKGYRREAFEEVWSAYLPEAGGNGTVEPLTGPESRDFDDSRTVDGNGRVNDSKSAKTPAPQGVSTVQRFENRGAEGKGTLEPLHEPLTLRQQPLGKLTAAETYRRASRGE